MKHLFLFFSFLLLSPNLFSTAIMPRLNASIFVNDGLTDFSFLFKTVDVNLKNKVQSLFEKDRLDHYDTKAFDLDAVFSVYWEKHNKYWFSLDLNKDGENEILYLNELTNEIEMESFEIYQFNQGYYKNIYKESGHLLAYKIHPNTKEIILFHHKYPCCSSVSHNINMVRLVNGKIVLRKKYVVASDNGMNGSTKFFPKKVKYTRKMSYLKQDVLVRWSSSIISVKASDFFESNVVGRFSKGAEYRVLFEIGKWKYVLMCAPPLKRVSNEGIIDSSNFMDVKVFGWIN